MATNEIQNGCEASIEAVLASNHKRRCAKRERTGARWRDRKTNAQAPRKQLQEPEASERNGVQEVTVARRKRRARGRAAGSLSILIVPPEKWRTDPREPVSREGGCRA